MLHCFLLYYFHILYLATLLISFSPFSPCFSVLCCNSSGKYRLQIVRTWIQIKNISLACKRILKIFVSEETHKLFFYIAVENMCTCTYVIE